ncbi:MAG: NIPSNAP family protein [Piscinibacter sp.]|nr:NIPSNAP family protein [Piscinibacter sp.]
MEAPLAVDGDSGVVELRQYTLHPGRRDELIELFDREFVETQEAQGVAVMGQFRDLDVAERFVWLRGFPDMEHRAGSLAAFYDGPVWQRHRDAANATMVDSDDVRLLRPAWPGAGIAMHGRLRPTGAVRMALPGVLAVFVFTLRETAEPELLRRCRDSVGPALVRGAAEVLGWYVTETAPNNFPRLPVRQGEQVLVGFAMFAGPDTLQALLGSPAWARDVVSPLNRWLAGPPQCLRLAATARSALHG